MNNDEFMLNTVRELGEIKTGLKELNKRLDTLITRTPSKDRVNINSWLIGIILVTYIPLIVLIVSKV